MSVKGSITYFEESPAIEEDYITISQDLPIDDDAIKSTILSCLIWYAHVPLQDVTISVQYGYVTLEGSVPWMYQKVVISSMVKNLAGVKGIINNIQIHNKLAYPFR